MVGDQVKGREKLTFLWKLVCCMFIYEEFIFFNYFIFYRYSFYKG